MNQQQRENAAVAELNEFLAQLQARYGVNVEPCLTTQEFPGRPPTKTLSINVIAIEGWQPPAPPEPPQK